MRKYLLSISIVFIAALIFVLVESGSEKYYAKDSKELKKLLFEQKKDTKSKPKYDRRLIDLLDRCFPVKEQQAE